MDIEEVQEIAKNINNINDKNIALGDIDIFSVLSKEIDNMYRDSVICKLREQINTNYQILKSYYDSMKIRDGKVEVSSEFLFTYIMSILKEFVKCLQRYTILNNSESHNAQITLQIIYVMDMIEQSLFAENILKLFYYGLTCILNLYSLYRH